MDTREALLVDAFTTEPMAGNPAGVVPDADGLTDGQMQAIAAELGASETAFVRSAEGEADRALRFFSPTQEVELCGHATVAAHAALTERGLAPGDSLVRTRVGDLAVTVEDDGRVWLEAEEPELRRLEVPLADVANALGIDVAALEDVGADLPLSRGSAGTPFVLVPVNFLEHLSDASPDPAGIEAVAEEAGAIGIYAFTFDTLSGESTWHARCFAPGAGIPEDPVTGTGAAACGAFVRRHGAVDVDAALRAEQGHFVDRPGLVDVRVDDRVAVGGRAVTVLDGDLVVPSRESDDIIEA